MPVNRATLLWEIDKVKRHTTKARVATKRGDFKEALTSVEEIKVWTTDVERLLREKIVEED